MSSKQPEKKTPPWKKKPKTEKPAVKLSAEARRWAEARAKAAGRTYPNLVDNMAAVRWQREKKG